MRDPTPVTIHLKDYTPPAFLIATVDLDVDIQDEFARVRAKLAVEAQSGREGPPGAARPRRRRARARVGRDRRPDARRRRIRARRRASDHRVGARRVHARDGGAHRAAQEHEADGPLRVEGRLLHPVRGARASAASPTSSTGPDVMARYTRTIHADAPGTRCCSRTAIWSRRGDDAGGRHWAKWEDPFPKPSLPLRDGGGEARRARGQLRHALRAQGDAAGLCRARQARPVRATPCRRSRNR